MKSQIYSLTRGLENTMTRPLPVDSEKPAQLLSNEVLQRVLQNAHDSSNTHHRVADEKACTPNCA